MADIETAAPASSDGEGMSLNMKIIIGGLSLLAVGGFAYYFLTKSTAEAAKGDTASSEESASSEDAQPETKTAFKTDVQSTPATSATAEVVKQDIAKAKGTSPIRTDHDGAYNYQKRNGVWYSAAKSTPNTWSSWGIDSSFAKSNPTGWAAAVADMNAHYPND